MKMRCIQAESYEKWTIGKTYEVVNSPSTLQWMVNMIDDEGMEMIVPWDGRFEVVKESE